MAYDLTFFDLYAFAFTLPEKKALGNNVGWQESGIAVIPWLDDVNIVQHKLSM